MPRPLGPHAYGQFALALAIVTLGSLSLSLAGSAVMNRFVPAAAPAERAAMARALAVRLARVRRGAARSCRGRSRGPGLTFLVAYAFVVPQLLAAEAGVGAPPEALRFGTLEALSGILGLIQHRGGVIAVALLGGSTVQQGYAGLALGVGLAATYVVWQTFVAQLPALAERWSTDPAAAEEAARRLARDALVGTIALAAQVSALWIRPAARVWTTAAGLVAFVGIAALAVPAWGAAGATTALLGGTAGTVVASAFAFPALISKRVVGAAFAGARIVPVVALGA